MFIYSWLLAIIALSVLPIQICLTLAGAPIFRRQFRQTAEENAKTQSHLVEVITGIQTVKAQNVEITSRWKWQELYSRYINKSFQKTISGTLLTQSSQVLQKISQLAVIWIGAIMVLKGELSLGQLIAFRIISGYVTQPLLRLSTIWQNIQELKISFERLADVIDTPTETSNIEKNKIPLPPIKGNIRYEKVSFNYNKQSNLDINNVSFSIKSGDFVGIVGQSGSGKSTLLKLLSRLYNANNGKIFIDDLDIQKIELNSLRRQIGIVPQEPLLFNCSISDNISLTKPEAEIDEIIQAAKIANAHEFIMNLPDGYSTSAGERGSRLSGGQRQRIAIARTLLERPKLLILDEATSALDYENERIICNQLMNNLKDSTIFFITHRLSSIKNADKILLLKEGEIKENGTHEELISKKKEYFKFYQQQGKY